MAAGPTDHAIKQLIILGDIVRHVDRVILDAQHISKLFAVIRHREGKILRETVSDLVFEYTRKQMYTFDTHVILQIDCDPRLVI